jgi:imidazolonepropionase-like amidohydrolase
MSGPRVFTSGPICTAPGGHPAGTIYKGNHWLIDKATRQVTDPAIARAEAGKLAAAGVDGIKCVYADGYGKLPKLSMDCLRAIIDEAHARKLWVAVHAQSEEEVRDALEAGADTIEHGHRRPLGEQTLALLAKPGVTLVPTLAVVEATIGPPPAPHTKGTLAAVKAVHAAGVRVAVGTDTQGSKMAFGTSVHRELELLVEAGLTPPEALLAATRDAAIALGQQNELGTIEVGKRADVILVKGEPWLKGSSVREVIVVIQAGKLVSDRHQMP